MVVCSKIRRQFSDHKIRRYALPYATIHLHQSLGGAQGQATDIEIQARQILRLQALLTGILAKHANQSLDVIERDADRDFYMDAQKGKLNEFASFFLRV